MVEDELYSERFLVKRPLLRAIAYEADALGAVAPPVLLVDEVDRADDEFEAFLLEILSDYTITVPELGHVPRRRCRRSWWSRRTAPATCTTR